VTTIGGCDFSALSNSEDFVEEISHKDFNSNKTFLKKINLVNIVGGYCKKLYYYVF
jgi:hypothetical protein